MSELLQSLLRRRNEPHQPRGIYSVCSAHPWVLEAAMRQTSADDAPLLIEATCNQVNQEGGYTGMRPTDFRELVLGLAAKSGFAPERLILGGDHLGPNPWRHLPAARAMEKAEAMVRAYADAGFRKIHLDASMACADDTSPLPDEEIAKRSARLCAAAEKNAHGARLSYVIGTEVPTPGGATESLGELEVTKPEAAQAALDAHREAFAKENLNEAWERVVALVVQPGVEFNHDSVVAYDHSRTSALRALLAGSPLIFEAHSTDYQRPLAYRALVEDGFCILKVGPALTFAMREALFGLAAVEDELIEEPRRSRLPAVMEEVMLASPGNWASHYHGDAHQQRLLRRYSYSDRIRYYWNAPEAEAAVRVLVENLSAVTIPETLMSGLLPADYDELRDGRLQAVPEQIVQRHIQRALEPYAQACRPA